MEKLVEKKKKETRRHGTKGSKVIIDIILKFHFLFAFYTALDEKFLQPQTHTSQTKNLTHKKFLMKSTQVHGNSSTNFRCGMLTNVSFLGLQV